MYIEYKDGEKYAMKDAELSDSLDSFTDAGYLLTDNDLVIDIDDIPREVIQKMIDIFNINTETVWTDRGAHLYFKRPEGFKGSSSITALGFNVEYKHVGNTKSVTVKRNGTAREVINRGIRENLPKYLTRGKYSLLYGMGQGGRNQTLFKHKGQVAQIEEWRTILRFVNEYIFDDPLPEDEFNTVARDMQFKAEKGLESQTADLIMNEKNVVKFSGALYWREGDNYTNNKDLLYRMVYRYCEGMPTRYVEEVISQLDKRCRLIEDDTYFYIKFKNGVLKDGKFTKLNYTDFTPFNIDVPYNPDATPVTEVDDYLNQLTDHNTDYRLRLEELFGHTLVLDKEFNRQLAKFSIFVGDGGNGKGTLLTIIRTILGPDNCSSLSIKNLTDERYLSTIRGKLVNLGDDIEDEAIDNEQMKVLKNISTSDNIEFRSLYQESKSTSVATSLIFTSNHKMKSFEKGNSYQRRVDWLPMYTKPKRKDPKFITKLTTPEALEYWVRLFIEGYMRLYKNGGFTESKVVADFNAEYHEDNNTALPYIRDLSPLDIEGKRNPEVYEPYKVWCEENGVNYQSAKVFKETVKEVYGLEIQQRKIDKKNAKVYSVTDNTPTKVREQVELLGQPTITDGSD